MVRPIHADWSWLAARLDNKLDAVSSEPDGRISEEAQGLVRARLRLMQRLQLDFLAEIGDHGARRLAKGPTVVHRLIDRVTRGVRIPTQTGEQDRLAREQQRHEADWRVW